MMSARRTQTLTFKTTAFLFLDILWKAKVGVSLFVCVN